MKVGLTAVYEQFTRTGLSIVALFYFPHVSPLFQKYLWEAVLTEQGTPFWYYTVRTQ